MESQKNKHFLHQTTEKNGGIISESAVEKDLRADLKRLGDMAATFAPGPLKPVSIPEQRNLSFKYLVPAAAFAVILLVVVFTYHTSPPAGSANSINLEVVYAEIENDTKLMNEVSSLVDDSAYSDFYPDAASVESRYDFSDEFIEVIVPI